MQSVDQLVGNFTSTGGLLHNEGFFRVAAGCHLYLISPTEACSAVRAGRWGDETDHFIHEITGYDHGDGHGDMESSGIETLLHNLKKHYKPDQQYDQVGAAVLIRMATHFINSTFLRLCNRKPMNYC